MDTSNTNEIPGNLKSEMVLSQTMENQLRQICIYAALAGIDMEEIGKHLRAEGKLPCPDKNSSKKVLSEIYDYVACSF